MSSGSRRPTYSILTSAGAGEPGTSATSAGAGEPGSPSQSHFRSQSPPFTWGCHLCLGPHTSKKRRLRSHSPRPLRREVLSFCGLEPDLSTGGHVVARDTSPGDRERKAEAPGTAGPCRAGDFWAKVPGSPARPWPRPSPASPSALDPMAKGVSRALPPITASLFQCPSQDRRVHQGDAEPGRSRLCGANAPRPAGPRSSCQRPCGQGQCGSHPSRGWASVSTRTRPQADRPVPISSNKVGGTRPSRRAGAPSGCSAVALTGLSDCRRAHTARRRKHAPSALDRESRLIHGRREAKCSEILRKKCV